MISLLCFCSFIAQLCCSLKLLPCSTPSPGIHDSIPHGIPHWFLWTFCACYIGSLGTAGAERLVELQEFVVGLSRANDRFAADGCWPNHYGSKASLGLRQPSAHPRSQQPTLRTGALFCARCCRTRSEKPAQSYSPFDRILCFL